MNRLLMSDDPRSTNRFREFFKAVRGVFRHHLICIAYCLAARDGQPSFKIATSFILEVCDIPILVTAGHVCEEIDTSFRTGSLRGISVLFAASKFDAEPFNLDAQELSMLWSDSEDDFDIGFMFLEPDLIERLMARGIEPISTEVFSEPSNRDDFPRFAVGFPVANSVVTSSPGFFVAKAGKILPHMKTQIGSIGLRVVPMIGFQTRRNSQFKATPVDPRQTSVAGMSGGVVIEFEEGKTVGDFRVVGIQSGESYIDDGVKKKATGFYVNDAQLALKAIEGTLRTLSREANDERS